MSQCIRSFQKDTKTDAICSKPLAGFYLEYYIQNRIYDDCTLELVKAYADNCLKIDQQDDSDCRVHHNTRLLTSGQNVEDGFLECLLLNQYDVKTANTFIYNGATCPRNNLYQHYIQMKSFYENHNCPDEYSANLNHYQLKFSDGTYCKQFVEMFEDYCTDLSY
ncbi:hypothetical protein EDM53_05650 [Rickettsiales endosymbiont of Peranema trichophorum]|uniref:hypothetical protein n=1 Tax=Rickettsiales endosymbiont of Peranema trichophorum TaxID=2486577 RepID=UPI0010235B67|nr:hypothetical protein [Rickettsiales endosymbiont of Peranema trichophorum]RZI45226.1 hypothetical protein EDM53_05650 [Rickettsiales endosymbiont of Peranema trichophorum]